MNFDINIIYSCCNWYKHESINKNLVQLVLNNISMRFDALKYIKKLGLSILLTDNNKMLELNTRFLNKTSTTNVISFPTINFSWENLSKLKFNKSYLHLGDIAFGYHIIAFESVFFDKEFHNHFVHLLVHSILHLIGFDHISDKDSIVMEELEVIILKDFNIMSPY